MPSRRLLTKSSLAKNGLRRSTRREMKPSSSQLTLSEWPELVTKVAGAAAAILSAIGKIREEIQRGRGPKRNLRELASEVDALSKRLEELLEVLATVVNNHAESSEGTAKVVRHHIAATSQLVSAVTPGVKNTAKLVEIAVSHEKRLASLEARVLVMTRRSKGTARRR